MLRTHPFTKIVAVLFIISSMFLQASTASAATFPIISNFSGSQPADWELRSDAVWNSTVSGDQTVRLTAAVGSQSGLAFYDDAFSSTLGIVTQIRYYSGGGTGADGFTFFLVDGDQVDESNIAAGASGGSLGYAQDGNVSPGIPHAYLGVGFDEFGSFATVNNSGQSSSPDSVVLRGAGNGTTGYGYLTQRKVATDFGQTIDGGWRLARITVLPNGGGSTVRVEMSWDEGATWLTIINNYAYNVTMPTNLKLGFTAGTGGSTNIHAIGDLSVTIPADLQVSMITSPNGTYKRGDSISYSFQVLNAGPNDAGTSTITNTLPVGDSGFSNLTWTSVTSTGTSTSGNGTNVASIPVSLPSGVSTTITVNAKIGKNVISTDDLGIDLGATPATGVSDPSPSTAQLAVNLSLDVPTPSLDSALDVIEAYAVAGGAGTQLTVADYAAASTTGVTADNLAAINAAVAAYGAGAAITPQALQAIIDQKIYDLANPKVIPTSSGGGTTHGCKDPRATNYNYFSASMPSLCVYASSTASASGSSTVVTAATVSAVTASGMTVRDLKTGMTGEDVKMLQKFLNANGYQVAASGAGAPGSETTLFGSLTRKALARYQAANKIVPAIGYFGPVTRLQMKGAGHAGLWW